MDGLFKSMDGGSVTQALVSAVEKVGEMDAKGAVIVLWGADGEIGLFAPGDSRELTYPEINWLLDKVKWIMVSNADANAVKPPR